MFSPDAEKWLRQYAEASRAGHLPLQCPESIAGELLKTQVEWRRVRPWLWSLLSLRGIRALRLWRFRPVFNLLLKYEITP